mgnify:CR=1 FL=1
MNLASLLPHLDRLIEADAGDRKQRALAPIERRLRRAAAKAFRVQERAFLRRFARLRMQFPPELREAPPSDQWGPLWEETETETGALWRNPAEDAISDSLATGAAHAAGDAAAWGIEGTFNLPNPEAVEYLRTAPLNLTKFVNDTSREQVRAVLVQAADEGWGYTKTTKELRTLFAGMRRHRAETIAITETGQAYEVGNRSVRARVHAQLPLEKSWLTVGTENVCPICRGNEGEGWIPFDQLFQSGHDHPVGHARCRCTSLARRAGAEG